MLNNIPQTEVTTGITDLIMAFALIPMIIALFRINTTKTKQKKWWIWFFITLECACILGFVAHFLCRDEISNMIVWIPLFPLMYEVVNCFFLTSIAVASEEKRPSKKDVIIVHAISFIAYLITRIIVHYVDIFDIILLTAFNTVVGVSGFIILIVYAVKKNRDIIVLAYCLIPLLIGSYFQIVRNTLIHIIWDFNEDSITHFLLTISFLILFFGVKKCLKDKENK